MANNKSKSKADDKKDKNENEKDDSEKKKDDEKDVKPDLPPTSFTALFGYSSTFDKLLITIGAIFALLIGSGLPALMIFMGKLTDTFINYEFYKSFTYFPNATNFYYDKLMGKNDTEFFDIVSNEFHSLNNDFNLTTIMIRLKLSLHEFVVRLNATTFWNSTPFNFKDDFISESNVWSIYMMATGVAFLICGYVMVSTFSTAANNQANHIRIMFFRSILKQDITWYDTKTSGDFATKVTADLSKIQDGIGDKVSLCIFSFSTVLFSLGTAFYYGWELTLIILSVMPVLVISFSIIAKIQARYSATEAGSYSKAGAIAEEVLGAIRTVFAFDGQNRELQRYDTNLEPAKKSGVRRTVFTALGLGMMWLVIYCSYGLAFWYGVKLIIRSIDNHDSKYEASTMMIVFFSVLMGTFSIGQTTPYFEAFAQARGAAALVFQVIERKPIIDSSSDSGVKMKDFVGDVEFRNVSFNYPARPDVKVLDGLHLVADSGQTVALVGPSGCGKSTVIQLLQRFYDVDRGQIFIDGKDIKELNVGWLRDHIGVVGQEPVLFGCSIAENIKLGYPEASLKDIETAAIDANANDFIIRLPHQFHTLVGERGSQLSGGQKQRIAIARALVRKPKILLLDESTSALDMQSESIVQAALDRASVGRTTFIVAHRLSTIRSADKIIVIDSGRVKEVGTHEELMSTKGLYFHLVKTQQQTDDETKDVEHVDQNGSEKKLMRALSVDSETGGGDIYSNRKDSIVIKEKEESPSLIRLLKLLKSDKLYVTIGCLSALIMGLSIPAFAIIFGEILGTLSDPSPAKIQENVSLYSLLFVVMGILSGIASFLQIFMFGVTGERLTMRLRNMTFNAMLRQEIAWFDESANSTGALCSRLSADASSVQGATGSRLSTLCQATSTLSAAIVIALIYSWKLGLVVISFIPIVIASTYFQMVIISGQISKDKKSTEESSTIAVEAISCIRTVASLHQENSFVVKYVKALEKQFRKSKIRAHLRGITFGIAQSMGTFAYAVALFYGSRLIVDNELTYGNLFKSVEAVIFGTAMVGQAVAFAPDYQKGKIAAVHIFRLLDRLPKICVNQSTGEKPETCNGNIEFRKIEFTYPNRPNSKILKGLTFNVSKGQTVALVGSSGCGKSTCIQLLERFYDINDGEVCLDNKNIVNLNIPWLRKQLGIVSQEPVLFGYSIGENIAYGDNSRRVEMTEIVRAAEKANIHNFIKELPMGYDTPVGDKGTQISGGQKQRIAIARALVRNPEILLLDEATSALDSESEKVVQEALDEARQGRTCIVIAHRLSTIHNADKIVVIHKGKVVEEGNHQELVARKGVYFDLISVQSGVN